MGQKQSKLFGSCTSPDEGVVAEQPETTEQTEQPEVPATVEGKTIDVKNPEAETLPPQAIETKEPASEPAVVASEPVVEPVAEPVAQDTTEPVVRRDPVPVPDYDGVDFCLPQYLQDMVAKLPGNSDVWKYFLSVTQIPRGSNMEGEDFRHKRIQHFLVEQAKLLGCEAIVDTGDNVIIRKPAVEGCENMETICLQCHMDMVVQKDDGVDIDLNHQALTPRIVDDYVMATGTSLGADNGIGIGLCYAILADKTIKHGPLEILVTRDEETGLYGAEALQQGILKASHCINVDSEDENAICVGCAGGETRIFTIPVIREKMPEYKKQSVILSNFTGGHTGADIDKNRANPIQIIARLLKAAEEFVDYRFISINCGTADNAIPRKCIVDLGIPSQDITIFENKMQAEWEKFRHEYLHTEIASDMTFVDSESNEECTTKDCTCKIIDVMNVIPYGPLSRVDGCPELVQASMTCAIAESKDDKLYLTCSIRANGETERNSIATKLESLAILSGIEISEPKGSYPGWEPDFNSEILGKLKEAYKEAIDVDARIFAIHAGLECGILKNKYPQMSFASVGPTVLNPHSPQEKLLISSVPNMYKVLVWCLEHIGRI
ncbi:hypothetical protein WA158_005314 [Blastocystis sp. Blastoise]